MASLPALWTPLRPPTPNRKRGSTSVAQNCGEISLARIMQISLSFHEKNSLHFRCGPIQGPLGTNSEPEVTVHLMTYLPWPDPASSAISQSNPPDPPDPLDCRGSPNPTQISSVQKPNHDSLVLLCRVCTEKMATTGMGVNRTWPSPETPPVPARLQPCATNEVKSTNFKVGLNWVGVAHWAIRVWVRPMRRRSKIESCYAYVFHKCINWVNRDHLSFAFGKLFSSLWERSLPLAFSGDRHVQPYSLCWEKLLLYKLYVAKILVLFLAGEGTTGQDVLVDFMVLARSCTCLE